MEVSAHIDTFARDNLPPGEQWPEFLPVSYTHLTLPTTPYV